MHEVVGMEPGQRSLGFAEPCTGSGKQEHWSVQVGKGWECSKVGEGKGGLGNCLVQ